MNAFADAVSWAEQATTWLESQGARERNAPPGTEYARRCHLLRNRLGSLQAALEVAAISPPGSESAEEARVIALRQAGGLAALLHDLQEAPWPAP